MIKLIVKKMFLSRIKRSVAFAAYYVETAYFKLSKSDKKLKIKQFAIKRIKIPSCVKKYTVLYNFLNAHWAEIQGIIFDICSNELEKIIERELIKRKMNY